MVPGASADNEKDRARALIAAYEVELSRNPELPRAGRLHYECARLYECALGDSARAAVHYGKAVAALPEHIPSIRGARRNLSSAKGQPQWPLFDAEVRVAPSDLHKAVVLEEKGILQERVAAGRSEAIGTLTRAQKLFESQLTLSETLAGALNSEESWEELDKVWSRVAGIVESDLHHKAALVSQRARLLEARRGDRTQAAELFRAALTLDPEAPGAIPALKVLDYAQQRWPDLVQVLEHEIQHSRSPALRAHGLVRVAQLLVDRIGNLTQGVAALERAAQEQPESGPILEGLGRLYELQKNKEGLASVLVRQAQLLTSPSERVVLYHRIGKLHEEIGGSEKQAIEWHSRALQAEPAFAPALEALGNLYGQSKQWEPWVAILINAAEATQDLPLRAAWFGKVAALYETELGNAELAIQHHTRALAAVRGYEISVKALSRLYEAMHRHQDLISLHERMVEDCRSPVLKIAHLFRIGLYQEDSLQVPAQAAATYERILSLDTHHLGAILALQRAAERALDYPRLVKALELEAQETSDKEQIAALLHRAGDLLDEQLGEVEAALVRYRKVLNLVPRHAGTLASLGRLFHRLGRWDDLLDNYRKELAGLSKGPEMAARLCTMAEVAKLRLANLPEALKLYREAVDVAPGHTVARRALERELSEAGHYSELAKLLDQELSTTEVPADRANLAHRLGEVYENRLNEPTKALEAYQLALKASASHRPALEGRIRLLAMAKGHARLAEELEHEGTRTDEPTLAADCLYRAALIRRDDLNDPTGATRDFEGVLALDHKHLGALLGLEPLYAKAGAGEKLEQILRTQAGILMDPGARVSALHRLSRVILNSADPSPERLRPVLFAILEVDGNDLMALFTLERVLLQESDRRILAQVDAKLARLVEEPFLAAAHLTRLGEFLESAGDARALDCFRTALEKDAENLAAAHGVTRLSEKSRDPALLEEASELQRRVVRSPSSAATLLVASAHARVSLGDSDGAAQVLARALELDPNNEAAAAAIYELLRSREQIDPLIGQLSHAAQRARPERSAVLWAWVASLEADVKGDVAAGIAALLRITASQPNQVPGHFELAKLYARDTQWANAARSLERVLELRAPADLARDATLYLAQIFDEHLGGSRKAITLVDKLLEKDPDLKPALERALSIHIRAGELPAAANRAGKLAELAPPGEERANAWLTLARIERSRNQLNAAENAYEQSIEEVGSESTAAAELREIYLYQKQQGHTPSWRGYVSALQRYLSKAEAKGGAVTKVILEAAQILTHELRQNEEALSLLTQGLEDDPTSADLHSERGRRLAALGQYEAALEAQRRVLDLDVTRVTAWRDLSATLLQMQRSTEAVIAIAPLVAIGQASDIETAQLAALAPKAALAPPGCMTPEEWQTLEPGPAADQARYILGILSEGLGKLYPADLSRFGLSSRDRILARSGHPLWALTERVAAIFGVRDFQLFVQDVHTGGVEIEFTDPVSVIVPSYVQSLPEPQQVFLLARILGNIGRRLSVVDRISPTDVAALVTAAERTVLPTASHPSIDEFNLTELSKRVSRSLSRGTRRMMKDVISSPSRGLDFGEFTQSIRLSAARAALIIADEAPNNVTLLRRLEGDLGGVQGEALTRGMRLAEDLLRYWVSENAFRLRKRFGML